MRFFFGIMGVIAVAVFYVQQSVGFYQSGVITSAGYDFSIAGSNVNLSGLGAVAILFFEAVLLPVARREFKKGKWATAISTFIVLIGVTALTVSTEFEAVLTSRADKSAQRGASVQHRDALLKELSLIVEQRDAWRARLSSPKLSSTEIKAIREQEEQASKRSDKLRADLLEAQANSGGNPVAIALVGFFGMSIEFWAMILLGIGIVVRALMRVCALDQVVSLFERDVRLDAKTASPKLNGPLLDVTPTPEPVKLTAEPTPLTPDTLPKPGVGQLKASSEGRRKVLPFLASDVSSVKLTSLDGVLDYVISRIEPKKVAFRDLYDEISSVAQRHRLDTPGKAIVGQMLRRRGYESFRDSAATPVNATIYDLTRRGHELLHVA